VEVAWAGRDRQVVCRVPHRPGMTAQDAVDASGIKASCPDLPEVLDVGVWGRPVGHGHELAPGDRVEVYRPLVYDPKEERRRRASLSRRAVSGS
jgi:hypothetical protein